MKSDITTRNDIELLVNSFYDKVRKDDTLAAFFTHITWEEHLEIMYNFWEAMLFQTQKHRGDLMARHVKVDEQKRTEKAHYTQWVNLFNSTVDEHFEGEKAVLAKNYAHNLSQMMQSAIKQQRNSMWKKFGA